MGNTPLFGADSRLDQDTVTFSVAADADFPTSNLNDDRPYTVYQNTTPVTELLITTDATTTGKVNYFMLVGHDLEDPNDDGSGACLLEFQHSDTDAPASYTTIFSVTPSDGLLIARGFAELDKRFYRMRITRGAAFVVNLGEAQWGKGVKTPFGLEVNYDPDAERVQARFNRTQIGNFVDGIHHFSERRARITLRLLSESFVAGTSVGDFKEFWDNHARLMKPFLFHWNASDDDATDVDHEFQAFFAMIDPAAGVQRPLATPLAKGNRNLTFSVVGLAGQ